MFSACIFPFHIWITTVFLYNFPSLILKANVRQILGVLATVLVFALIESLCLFVFLVFLAVVLPKKYLRDRFVQLGSLLAMILAGLALLVNTQIVQETSWILLPILVAISVYLIIIQRRPIDRTRQSAFAERFTLLSGLYFFLDLACLLYLMVDQLLL